MGVVAWGGQGLPVLPHHKAWLPLSPLVVAVIVISVSGAHAYDTKMSDLANLVVIDHVFKIKIQQGFLCNM